MINYILPVLGFAIALKLPDIDLAPLFWRHRSGYTHGPILPLVLYCLVHYGYGPSWMYWLVLGALPGLLIHYFFDCFPQGWAGTALIHWHPIRATWPASISALWIALGVFVTAKLSMDMILQELF